MSRLLDSALVHSDGPTKSGLLKTEVATEAGSSNQAVTRPMITILTPAFNEAQNLPALYERLCQTMKSVDMEWEWLIVDDHSRDETFAVVCRLAQQDRRVRGIRFARNFGSHTALMCGLRESRGACVTALAADLQDPPETIPELLAHWRNGTQVVWAARNSREGESATTIGMSRLYYWMMRNVVGIKEMPATGADFFLLDRKVVQVFNEFSETNVSVFALLTWMGFRQATITYDKHARLHGESGWSMKKKLKLVVDSVTSFSYVPIRFMSYFGFLVAICGFVFAAVVVVNAMRGAPVQGWSSLMVIVLLLGGVQMVMMGVLGEYLWRALDAARGRPRYIIEASTQYESVSEAASSGAGIPVSKS